MAGRINGYEVLGRYFTRGLYKNIVEDFAKDQDRPVAIRIVVPYRGQIAICSGLRQAVASLGYPFKVYARGPFVYLTRGPAALRKYQPDEDRGRYTP